MLELNYSDYRCRSRRLAIWIAFRSFGRGELNSSIDQPAVQRLRAVLAGARWREILANLRGYQPPASPGGLLVIEEALPWWRRAKSKETRLQGDAAKLTG